jgi:hypothetical protein
MHATQTITEASREIKVIREADVVVVGGGPGGVSAAISAARGGAKTVLLERYGHLGGMATGGLVNAIPNLTTIEGEQVIAGIVQETIGRVSKRGCVHALDKQYWGTSYKPLVDLYLETGYSIFFLRKHPGGELRLIYSVLVDPEILKHEFNEMCLEAGVDVFLHSWGAEPIMDGNTAKGVVFESKSGRLAVLAKVVIDATGDGDIFCRAGARYDENIHPGYRHSNLALSCWIAGVDTDKRHAFRKDHAEEYAALMRGMRKNPEEEPAGFLPGMAEVMAESGLAPDVYFRDILPGHDGILIAQPHVHADDQADTEEMTRVNIELQKMHVDDWEYLRAKVPGFERSYIVQTGAQLGTTGGRRVVGEHQLSIEDLFSDMVFEDTVAVFPNIETGATTVEHPKLCVPYRALIPKEIEGLLVACRGFSSTDEVNEFWNLIPHCMCIGQAAGAAAAIAAAAGTGVRDIDFEALRSRLTDQGAILP